jgi:hypothetical protein
MGQVSESAVRDRSYFIWLAEGKPHGRDLDHWLQAQAEFEAGAGPEPTGITQIRMTEMVGAGRIGKAAKISAGKKATKTSAGKKAAKISAGKKVGAKGRSSRATRT